jgi:hypothetical protein
MLPGTLMVVKTVAFAPEPKTVVNGANSPGKVLAGHEAIGVGLLGFAALSGFVGLFIHGRATLRPNPLEPRSKKPEEPKAVAPPPPA